GLVERPRHKALVCAHFSSLDASMRGTVIAVGHQPAAVELMDKRILDQTRGNIEQARNRFWLEGDPEAVLAIEFYDQDPEQLVTRMERLIADYKEQGLGYAFPIVRGNDLKRVWDLRKAGLGLLMGVPGDVKAVTVIEDTAVAVDDLPDYVKAINAILHRYDTQCVFYAHASVGELHLRPELNLREEEGLFKFRKIAEDTAEVVSRFGGSLSGEHGDGRLRGPFVRRMLGDEVYGMLEEIKRIGDPYAIFNPNKIIDAQPIDTDLRMKTGLEVPEVETFFDWSADFGLVRAAEKCNGAGACRKSAGRGTMCPSYMATHEERDTTRGRANVFRHALSQNDPREGLTRQELYDVLDLCLSCKGCKSECPANVDMARMKAEFLQHYYDRHGTPLRSRVFGEFANLTRLGSWTPWMTSAIINSGPMKWMLGVHSKRTVPALARQSFGSWARRHTPIQDGGQERAVVLFNDAFTHYNDPHVGRAAVRVLERAGYALTVTQGLHSGRTQISKGLLRRARTVVSEAVEALYPIATQGTPIVGLEPSAILSFRDEVPDLVEGEDLKRKARAVAERALTFEEFIVQEADAGRLDDLPWAEERPDTLLLHGHCHQKAIVGIEPSVQMLSIIPDADVRVIPSGCCGMAGSFGYEREHYDLSMQVGELVLFPAVRESDADTVVVAAGTSCRHQIADGTGRHALHPAEVLARALGVTSL
ncbi:MAG: FAD-linked oxidase C-terminal domain-containing protein, partial [Myxococcota bacterium]